MLFRKISLFLLAGSMLVNPICAQNQAQRDYSIELKQKYRDFKKDLIRYRDCILGKRKCTEQEKKNIKKGLVVAGVVFLGAVGAYRYYLSSKRRPLSMNGLVPPPFDEDFSDVGTVAVEHSQPVRLNKRAVQSIDPRGIIPAGQTLYDFLGHDAAHADPKRLAALIKQKIDSLEPVGGMEEITSDDIRQFGFRLRAFFGINENYQPTEKTAQAKAAYDKHLADQRIVAGQEPFVGVRDLLENL